MAGDPEKAAVPLRPDCSGRHSSNECSHTFLSLKQEAKITNLLNIRFSICFALIPLLLIAAASHAEEVVYKIDFTKQANGDATEWLKEQGFDFKRSAAELNPRFEDDRLVLETGGKEVGLFVRELELAEADRIRIHWGVDRYPQGADWAEGVYRVPVAAMISFGEKKIDSGSLFVPNAPYFIGLFLGEKEQEGYAYTAQYYQEGGRYFCTPCKPATGTTVTTEFNLNEAFQEQFDASSTPPISSFGFQMNTEDTQGGARSFLKTVEFISS